MAQMTVAERNSLCAKYAADCLFAAIYTTAPTVSAAGTEPSGGSPAYARKGITWGTPSGGAVTATPVVFDAPANTYVGYGHHSALTAGNYLHGVDLSPSIVYSSQGTLTATPTYTQS